jgi:hypothetical protein
MITTATPFITAEADYHRERIAADFQVVRRVRSAQVRRRIRLKTHLRTLRAA